MLKKSLMLLACGLISTAALANSLDGDCLVNSTCSFMIEGQMNKIIHTYHIEPNKMYACTVTQGDGNLFDVNNVQPSPGIRWALTGRLNNPLYLFGAATGEGAITYTLHNNNKIWKFDRIRYECKESTPQ